MHFKETFICTASFNISAQQHRCVLVRVRVRVCVRHSWGLCCFSPWDPGGMRELLSARGHDGALIRLLVCGDPGARVNQRQTDPSSPRGFTLSLPPPVTHPGTRTATVAAEHKLTRRVCTRWCQIHSVVTSDSWRSLPLSCT